jgi:hypothetical protein
MKLSTKTQRIIAIYYTECLFLLNVIYAECNK